MKNFHLLLLSACLSACVFQKTAVYHERCLSAHEQRWSQLLQKFVCLSEVANIRLAEQAHKETYALLSEDFQQAELFLLDAPKSLLLESVKGGYRSEDGRYYLQRQEALWYLRETLPSKP